MTGKQQSPDPSQEDRVQGERETSSVTRVLSVQSRVSNWLAIGLMSAFGLGSLAWYYTNALTRQTRAKESAQAASNKRAQADMPLPSLGRIDPPSTPVLGAAVRSENWPRPDPPQEEQRSAATLLAEIPVMQNPTRALDAAPSAKTPSEIALERELSGAVFAAHGASSAAAPGIATLGDPAGGVPGLAGAGQAAVAGPVLVAGPTAIIPANGELSSLLLPRSTPAVRAQMLPARRLLLPKGAFIDCTLETAIDSTLPGMTTCVMATDTFGVDGNVVLLERGTRLIGETRGQVQQGAARIFVLWIEARTPAGVIVPLDSPGADELGRSGLPGEVNRHFWQRFGAAMLISVINGAVQEAAQASRSGGTVVVNPPGSQDVLTEILKSTISIPPTVTKHNGDRIQVLVARDLDFRSVYELRSAADR